MTDAIQSPQLELAQRFQQAVAKAFGPEHAGMDPLVRRSERADFQANLAMSLGKAVKKPPREVAQALLDALDAEDLCEKLEIAGPGFINVTLKDSYLGRLLTRTLL